MTRLAIVPAAEVGDRPRWWCANRAEAERLLSGRNAASIAVQLHTPPAGTVFDVWCRAIGCDPVMAVGIVAEIDDPVAIMHVDDPRTEAVWLAAACAVLERFPDGTESSIAKVATIADLVTVEWRKRWGAKARRQ